MAYTHHERLSALDALFLEIEDPQVHMHVGAVAVLDAAPLTLDDGSLHMARIRASLEASLRNSPRFRQRLAEVPLFENPVWVDDDRFNLDYHLRHTSLPRPGGAPLLKRLAGRILSQKLDRGRPLWEFWVVEGVAEGRLALVLKAHHCMVDGIAGLDLLAGMLRGDPDPTVAPDEQPWLPRPQPGSARLLLDELWHRASWPLGALASGRRGCATAAAELRDGLRGLASSLGTGLRPTSSTPLNADVGPHRRFDWTRVELAAAKEVRAALGGTLNDVVLTTAAGAIGRFLRGRGMRVDELVFRAQIPMSTRQRSQRGDSGNRVVMLLADLPIAERDPRRRFEKVVAATQRLKGSGQRAGVQFLEDLGDRAGGWLFFQFARFATWQRAYNVVVTNVPGPQQPLYLLGARLQEIYPLVPLAWNQALGIALFSYDGGLFWGLNADWEAVPDLHHLREHIEVEFERLHKAAATSAVARDA